VVCSCSSAPVGNSDHRHYSEGLGTATVSVYYTSDLQRPKLQAYRMARDAPIDPTCSRWCQPIQLGAQLDAPIDPTCSRWCQPIQLGAQLDSGARGFCHPWLTSLQPVMANLI